MKDVRETIRKRLREIGETERSVSLKIGMNGGYLNDFLKGKQKELRLPIIIPLARELRMDVKDLATQHQLQQLRVYQIDPGSFEEDAEPYEPASGSLLVKKPAIGYVRMTSNVLEQHPLRISIGDILGFDMSPQAVENIDRDDPAKFPIVLAQLYDRADPMKATTVVRQYLRPGLLLTNRESGNEVFSLQDKNLPFEPRIKGVFVGFYRPH
jgi:hypothetical protein